MTNPEQKLIEECEARAKHVVGCENGTCWPTCDENFFRRIMTALSRQALGGVDRKKLLEIEVRHEGDCIKNWDDRNAMQIHMDRHELLSMLRAALSPAPVVDEKMCREKAREIVSRNPLICQQCGASLPNPECGHRANGVFPCCQPQTESLEDAIYAAMLEAARIAKGEG